MRYYCLLLVWSLLLVTPTGAQEMAVPLVGESRLQETSFPEPRPLHVSDYLSERSEARASLMEFHTLRESGAQQQLVIPPQSYSLGDTERFRAFNFIKGEREELQFTLQVVDGPVRMWVETAELESITSDELEALRRAFKDATPGGSIDTDQGILDISTSIFGERPNVRGDGSLDVLLLDIRDHYHPQHRPQFVAGFVDPADLTDRGNERDIVYLDLRPGLVLPNGDRRNIASLQSTAAHEYQHLIHMNYDRREMTFVNEGMSEWSEVLHGFPRRNMSYLSHSDAYNVGLLRWRPRGTPEVIDDYERAGLLTTYLSERLGVEATGSITRDPATGSRGYRNAAAAGNRTFQDMLVDFHVANYVNNEEAGEGLGYRTHTFDDIRAEPGTRTDGRTAVAYTGHKSLRPGAVQYLKWNLVDDFSIELNGAAPLRARAILYHDDIVTIQSVPVGMVHAIHGSYDRIVLALVHTDPDADPLTAHFSATWTAEEYFQPETVAFGDDTIEHYIRGREMELLTRFSNPFPGEGFLATVDLPLYFFSQFSNPDAPPRETRRIFTFVIRAVADDGSPSHELFTLTMDDPRGFWFVSGRRLRYLHLDLTEYVDQLSNLPETVYIGFRDVAHTLNQAVFPATAYTTENVSYVGSVGDWTELWDFVIEREDQDDLVLDQLVIPIRATYFAPTDEPLVIEDDPLPMQVALSPNAPNPFTTTSRIGYTLPRDMRVRLEVHDTLGRRVAVLQDGGQLAGEHQVLLDAREWSSGVYFVTLTAEGERISRSVVVVR